MNVATEHVIDYYAAAFADGMVDLSSSSPRPTGGTDEEYPPIGGSLELRACVAARYPGLAPENVVITNGASGALAAAAYAFAKPGEVIAAARGAYPSFTETARKLGATLIGELDARAGVHALLINNPTVPGGKLVDIGGVLRRAEFADARLICDEVYLDLRANAGAIPAAVLSGTAISIGDVSKPLGLGGLRIGWAASRDTAALQAISRSVALLSGGPSTIAMERAFGAMREYERLFSERCAAAAENAPAVFRALRDAGWSFEPPEAGWTFLAWPPEPLTDERQQMLRAAGFFLVPGSAFGLADGYRVSVFAPAHRLCEALSLATAAAPVAERALVVFAKAPVAGFAKTRLATALGDQAAAALANAFLCDTLKSAAQAADARILAFTPAAAAPMLGPLAPGWRLEPQPVADFGTRLSSALETALNSAARGVLIGSDTPDLPSSIIVEAFEQLANYDLAVGPASDGGFYLLGVKQCHAGLFDGVEWSTSTVCSGLLQNARRLGLSVSVLPEWTDIDDLSSLNAAARRIAVSRRAPLTLDVIEGLKLEARHGA